MLYTRKGDKGTTKVLNRKAGERVSKDSCQTNALGDIDELNSFLGFVKIRAAGNKLTVSGKNYRDIIHDIQEALFIVQAEIAGADKRLSKKKVAEAEGLIEKIEKKLPPMKTFFISGGIERAALLDFARTVCRRAERSMVSARESGDIKVGSTTLAYLNRLSSLLYALARFANYNAGIKEEPPSYK